MASMKTRATFAALVMISAGFLSACGGNPVKNAIDDAVDNAVNDGVEKVVENAAGGDVDINVNVDGAAVDLPADFPSDIPLPDDATLLSTLFANGGWTLGYSAQDSGPATALAEKYKSDSAWTLTQESLSEGFSTWMFTSDQYQVIFLGIGDAEQGYVIDVTVSPVTAG